MNKEIYEQLAEAFEKYRIEEDVEDVLLELAEILADQGSSTGECCVADQYGKIKVEAYGTCTPDEEDPEEASVYIRMIRIGIQEFAVEDYLI